MIVFAKSFFNILKLIYENPGIKLSDIMMKAKVSANTLKSRINDLLENKMIIEKKITGGKRVLLKNFYPNFESEEGKYIFSLIETVKKRDFFNKNPKFIGPFKQLMSNVKDIRIVIVFGSFASYSQTKDSDVDILLLIEKEINKEFLKKEIEKAFVTLEHEISPRVDTIKNFIKNKNESIYQNIIKNHIIIKGALEFVDLMK